MSAPGSTFNCCTALGKNLNAGPPVTLIKDCPPGNKLDSAKIFEGVEEDLNYRPVNETSQTGP